MTDPNQTQQAQQPAAQAIVPQQATTPQSQPAPPPSIGGFLILGLGVAAVIGVAVKYGSGSNPDKKSETKSPSGHTAHKPARGNPVHSREEAIAIAKKRWGDVHSVHRSTLRDGTPVWQVKMTNSTKRHYITYDGRVWDHRSNQWVYGSSRRSGT